MRELLQTSSTRVFTCSVSIFVMEAQETQFECLALETRRASMLCPIGLYQLERKFLGNYYPRDIS